MTQYLVTYKNRFIKNFLICFSIYFLSINLMYSSNGNHEYLNSGKGYFEKIYCLQHSFKTTQ